MSGQGNRPDAMTRSSPKPADPYLDDVPRTEAQQRLKDALQQAGVWRMLGAEQIALDEHCVGRVTATPIWARLSSPNYHSSAMDGFAVEAEDTKGATPAAPILLHADGVGRPRAQYVDTGDPIPDWADAVIPIEIVEPLDSRGNTAANPRSPALVRIRSAVTPWSHIRPMGEDIVASQLVLPSGATLRAVDLGALAAAGWDSVSVARKPRVAIIPTGSELVPIGSDPGPAQIIEYNSIVLAAQVNGMGALATRLPIVPDNVDAITEAVKDAASVHDLVLLNAGSSAGSEDFSASVIAGLGQLLVHGVAVRPGHPVIMGVLREDVAGASSGRTIIGVPGYPVSAALTGEIFVEPLISTWLGRTPLAPQKARAILTRKLTSPAGDEDHIRVALGRVGGRLLAAPLASGAGVITSLVRADGIVEVPPGIQGIDAGDSVHVRLYRAPAELEHTILCIGSHDLTLDVMAQFLARAGRRLVSANAGSQSGLIALNRDQSHMAGSHLMDPDTGEYNLGAIRRYLPGRRIKAISLALRDQGLIVKNGNPKSIRTLEALARPDVSFINRQRGAGTRVLLDHQLLLRGISPESIRGYNLETYTHLAVATAVASGRADCGLGIRAAAAALDLDFLPLFQERYDLIMLRETAESELMAPLLFLLGPGPFRDEVSRLPGYDVSVMGQSVLEDE